MPMFWVSEIWNSVREKSVKSQGIFFAMICWDPAVGGFFPLVITAIYRFYIGDRLALLSTWALWPFRIWNRGPPSRSRPSNNHI